MSGVEFSPKVLSSYEQFKGFFEANKNTDKKRILYPLSKREVVVQYINDVKNHFKFTRSATYPPNLFQVMYARDYNQDWSKKNPYYDLSIYPFKKKDLLADSYNFQHVDTSDIYMQKPLPFSCIKDPKIVHYLPFHPLLQNPENFKFYLPDYVCQGISTWFSSMYFETKKDFPDTPEGHIQHIRAITNLFSRGAPRAASLLQACNITIKDFNLLNIRELESRAFFYKKTHLTETRIDNWNQLVNEINKLSPGLYRFNLNKNVTIYIKTSDDRFVFFDPNHGSFLIKGKQGVKRLVEYITNHYGTHGGSKDYLMNFVAKGFVLGISKIVPNGEAWEKENQKIVLLRFLNLFTYPIRFCYFEIVRLIENIVERSLSLIKLFSIYFTPKTIQTQTTS